jgi:NAD(P)-dependent dehydrogenase (short-subunit alcohol dehydrogenase family)
MEINLSGSIAFIAGGTGGLGRAVCLAFLAEDATVIVTYRKQDEFASLQHSAGPTASRLEGHSLDVTDEKAVAECVNAVLESHGKIDALVNTVGAYAGGVSVWDLEPQIFDRLLSLNLRAGYVLSRATLPGMLHQKRGTIVNVVAKAALDHAAGASAYAASKAGALALMDSIAADVKGKGVRVNSILPSIIDTEVNRRAMPDANFAVWPKPEDIAKVILFLCSEQAKVIHGAAISVYGDS